MNTEKLRIAVAEAHRFLQRAEHLQLLAGTSKHIYNNSKEQGSVRRASMDLTRALADLRNTR